MLPLTFVESGIFVALGKIVTPVSVIFQSCHISVVAAVPVPVMEGRVMPGGSVTAGGGVYSGVVWFV
jgi:hypothetical protein